MNKYFDKIYCINLDRREDKWLRTKSLLEKVGMEAERLSAIDGRKPLKTNINFTNLSLGEIGCLLSHLEVYKDALANGYDRILVLEDDVLPHKDINKLFKDFKNMLNIADVTWIGSNQFEFVESGIHTHYKATNTTWGTFAYMIKPKLMEYLLSLNYFNTPIDGVVNQFQGLVIVPQLFIADISDSDIRQPQDINVFKNYNGWEIKNYLK